MPMELKDECQPLTQASPNGMSIEEALAFHRGWDAARKGQPREMGMGHDWLKGWLTYQWLKDQPEPSYKRH